MNKLINLLKKSKSKCYLIGLSSIILDQLTKILVIINMNEATEITIIPNFFKLFFVTNTGAAFSSLKNHLTLLIIISLFCIALIVNIIEKEEFINKINIFSLGLIFGGITSNLIDRVFYKKVIDFLSFTIFSYNFPVFNLADVFITGGVFIYIISNIFKEVEDKKINI